jgi:hypothetical protein
MMTIASKTLNQYLAFGMTNLGHLYVSINGSPARQCCERGQIGGGWTVLTTPETFERDARRWYRAHVRRAAEMA